MIDDQWPKILDHVRGQIKVCLENVIDSIVNIVGSAKLTHLSF